MDFFTEHIQKSMFQMSIWEANIGIVPAFVCLSSERRLLSLRLRICMVLLAKLRTKSILQLPKGKSSCSTAFAERKYFSTVAL